jgi:hypothetical protein
LEGGRLFCFLLKSEQQIDPCAVKVEILRLRYEDSEYYLDRISTAICYNEKTRKRSRPKTPPGTTETNVSRDFIKPDLSRKEVGIRAPTSLRASVKVAGGWWAGI